MAQSVDPDHFFQTSASLEQRQRRAAKAKTNVQGNPIRLSSKPLALIAYPDAGHDVYVAMSAGEVRRVDIKTRSVGPTAYRCPAASSPTSDAITPLTSLAILPPGRSSSEATLFAGSWSSQIYAWNISTRELLYVLDGGHNDFVKTLSLVPLPILPHGDNGAPAPRVVLASAGADSRIVLWDVNPDLAQTCKRQLATLSAHTRSVLALAADPYTDGEAAVLFSGSSDAEICQWQIQHENSTPRPTDNANYAPSPLSIKAGLMPFPEPLRPHHTSITALAFSAGGDLWSASADGSSKCYSRPEATDSQSASAAAASQQAVAAPPWAVDTTFEHGAANPVRCLALSPDGRYVVTGCRDEDVWVWEAASGSLAAKFSGHADEVGALVVLLDSKTIVSTGLDCTLRTWSIDDGVKQHGKDKGEEPQIHDGQQSSAAEDVPATKVATLGLTDEEEAELAALMDDDDDD